jgi:hypothetical protein
MTLNSLDSALCGRMSTFHLSRYERVADFEVYYACTNNYGLPVHIIQNCTKDNALEIKSTGPGNMNVANTIKEIIISRHLIHIILNTYISFRTGSQKKLMYT